MKKRRQPRAQHDPAYTHLRSQLRQMRRNAELSQAALGELLERPQTYVHKIESGDRRIDPVEFCRWCLACKAEPKKEIDTIAKTVRRKR